MRTGDVSLGFTVTQTTWRHDWQEPGDLAPAIGDVRADRVAYDEKTGDDVELVWDDGAGA